LESTEQLESKNKKISRKVGFWGFLAFLVSLIDDDPVNADQLLGFQLWYVMEVILRLLSIFFFYLAVHEAMKVDSSTRSAWKVAAWTALAFVWSSADDIPLNAVRVARYTYWYPFDLVTHAVSFGFFYLALRETSRSGSQ
jgi:hypothetical protein